MEPYKNPHLPISERVADLLPRMTLKEKVAQLMHHWKTTDEHATFDKYKEHGVGSVYVFWVDDLEKLQRYCMEETRLGIPANVVTEALHGGGNSGTVFPMPVMMASTWNLELTEKIYQHIAKEARMVGANQTMSPNLDVMTDPRFGRVDESYGEDPYLSSVFAVVAVRGMQGEGPEIGPENIAATAKHFAAYSMAENGQDGGAADLSEQSFRERYLPPFKAAIEAGAKCIMPSHAELNGVPCHANQWLLTDLLREELGFEGMVVADAGDCNLLPVFGVAKDLQDSAIQCLNAGVDQELYVSAYEHLESAVESGKLDEAIVDRAVARVLKHKFDCGLFENPYPNLADEAEFDSPQGRELAYQVAVQGITLLKNEEGFLPLKADQLKTVALIGPNIDEETNQQGAYTRPGAEVITVKRGLENRLPDGVELKCAQGCEIMDESTDLLDEAVALAKEADLVVLALGDNMDTCRECYGSRPGDRTSLNLAGGQQALLDAVRAVNPNTVLVLIHGRPHSIVEAQGSLPAILAAGRCGEEGGHAIADILLGTVNPSGRLTMTYPRSVGQLPIYYYRKKRSFPGRQYTFESPEPLYPFGHGLSYTSFEWTELAVSSERIDREGSVTVSLLVTNTGTRSGADVVQVYAHDPLASVTRPMRQLVGFTRVALDAGESRKVEIEIEAAQLGYYDRNCEFVVDDGVIELIVARDASDQGQVKEIVVGDAVESRRDSKALDDALIPD